MLSPFTNYELVFYGAYQEKFQKGDCLTTAFFGHNTILVIMNWNIRNSCSWFWKKHYSSSLSRYRLLCSPNSNRSSSLKPRVTQHPCSSILLASVIYYDPLHFCGISCNFSFSISDFMDLGLIFFSLMSLAEGLSVLFIFSKRYLEFLKPMQYSLG